MRKTTEKQKQQMKEYYLRNKAQILSQKKEYRDKNSEIILQKKKEKYWKNREIYLKRMKENWQKNKNNYLEEGRKRGKIWYEKNKIKRRKQLYAYEKQKKLTDPNYKLRKNLRRLLRQAINYYEKRGVFLHSSKYPIDFASIITYLSPFPDRKVYEIDHIQPLCSFDLTDPEQIRTAFAPENHQWLLAIENMKKGRATSS